MKKVVVGSKNPVKVEAVEEALSEIYGEVEVDAYHVPSGVSEMPASREEAIKGAENRAKKALKKGDCDFPFGIEGFVEDAKEGMFLSRWTVALDRNGDDTLSLLN